MCNLFLCLCLAGDTKRAATVSQPPPPPVKDLVRYFLYNSTFEKYKTNFPSTDGFGVACRGAAAASAAKWMIYKSPYNFVDKRAHNTFTAAITSIDKNPDCVLAHTRRRDVNDASVSFENTHPFSYKDHVIIHNGYLRGFSKLRKTLLEYVHPIYRGYIKGETDTEFLLYIYLTFLENAGIKENTVTANEAKQIWKTVFDFIRDKHIHSKLNIIYSARDFVIVTKYVISGNMKNTRSRDLLQCNPLFIGRDENRILVTTRPLFENQTSIPRNSIMIL
jgi:predicted glutamine amidotransferase